MNITYMSQARIYAEQQQEKVRMLEEYLSSLFKLEGEEFVQYQRYFTDHYKEMDIPVDFRDADAAYIAFRILMQEHHPGKTLGVSIPFESLDPEVQKAYAIYKHEQYITMLETARDDFNLEYVYYIKPSDDSLEVFYILDGIREPRQDNIQYINIGERPEISREEHGKLWEAWENGVMPDGADTFDNEYGKTYAYYLPLYIEGEKLGLICTDISIASFNKGILVNTLKQMVWIVLVIIICTGILLWIIRKFYIYKIEDLASSVQAYSDSKDPQIVARIEKDTMGNDEISALANQTAAMILELDSYMKDLVKTTKQLSRSQNEANMMRELAIKDSLTGIRNKTAYDSEIEKLSAECKNGLTEFGIAVIDLNFLKKLNDTYGHDKGNLAIKQLSKLVCNTFEHSPVFRIGGDEFVVILKNRDLNNIDILLATFKQELKKYKTDKNLHPWEQISAAIGYAKYDSRRDDKVSDVFRRADREMYKNKKDMKAIRSE